MYLAIIGVTGSFEGWVPVATDLYYNGVNTQGFTLLGAFTFQNTQILHAPSPIGTTGTSAGLKFNKTIDVKSYSKLILQGSLRGFTSMFYWQLFDSSGGTIIWEPTSSADTTALTIDITQLTQIPSTTTLRFEELTSGSYINRIRLA